MDEADEFGYLGVDVLGAVMAVFDEVCIPGYSENDGREWDIVQ